MRSPLSQTAAIVCSPKLRGSSAGSEPARRSSCSSGRPTGEGSCIGNLGTGIFDDDTTCEVCTHYRSALRAGIPGPELTDQILRDHLE